jgi:hypothetical protein
MSTALPITPEYQRYWEVALQLLARIESGLKTGMHPDELNGLAQAYKALIEAHRIT